MGSSGNAGPSRGGDVGAVPVPGRDGDPSPPGRPGPWRRARPFGPAARYLVLLLLLTPLLGTFRALIVRGAVAAQPEVVTEVVEVPRTVYVEVPTVKLLVVRDSSGSA